MQGVRVDPKTRRAYLEAGSLLGQLDHECAAFGLATTAGTVSHTGAAGLTLGGGFGRLGRRFGLACDNVASFDIVTADGRFVRANVYVGAALTDQGLIEGRADAVQALIRRLGAPVAVWADVDVKHAAQLAPRPLGVSTLGVSTAIAGAFALGALTAAVIVLLLRRD